VSGHQYWPQGNLQRQFLLGADGRIWPCLQQRHGMREHGDGIRMGVASQRVLCRLLQILYSALCVLPALKV